MSLLSETIFTGLQGLNIGEGERAQTANDIAFELEKLGYKKVVRCGECGWLTMWWWLTAGMKTRRLGRWGEASRNW